MKGEGGDGEMDFFPSWEIIVAELEDWQHLEDCFAYADLGRAGARVGAGL